jgi:dipeptidyl aminopeptidase/acylaminoacyl peptidase
MIKKVVPIIVLLCIAASVYYYFHPVQKAQKAATTITQQKSQAENEGGPEEEYPLSIPYMRKQEYPGSEVTIEEMLPSGSNYDRYIASYKSDGLKIYALLTVPQGEKPKGGWPVIIFNHGYIPPEEYRTTERYIAYTDAFSRKGYIVFKSDYRGHGNSEGKPEGGYYSPGYTIDVLNAVATVKRLKIPSTASNAAGASSGIIVNPDKIGMWGHSMGGSLTLRTMVVSKDIKAGVIWGGVVAGYKDLAENWHRSKPFVPSEREQLARRNNGRQKLIRQFGTFDQNPAFWSSIAPISYVSDISGPLKLGHGTDDEEVPLLFSQRLDDAMKAAGKPVEFYSYEGDDHNISHNLDLALERSVGFFDRYLK